MPSNRVPIRYEMSSDFLRALEKARSHLGGNSVNSDAAYGVIDDVLREYDQRCRDARGEEVSDVMRNEVEMKLEMLVEQAQKDGFYK